MVFAVLFLRLWSLQVLSGDEYLNAAQDNQLRLVRVEAPRGPILDRHGRSVVSNVAGTAVQLWVGDMPRGGALRARPPSRARSSTSRRESSRGRSTERRSDPITPITVKTSVGEEQVNYLLEHQAEFPGVEIAQIYLRDYEYNTLAAHILGYVGEISPEELKRLRKDGYRARRPDREDGHRGRVRRYLRGRAGRDADPRRLDRAASERASSCVSAPRAGLRAPAHLDIRLQRAAERALQHGIDLAHENDHWAANGGAIVAMDPRDGAILAMASSPTYKPVALRRSRRPGEARPLLDEEAARACELPGREPRDRRPLPAGLDLEACDGARRRCRTTSSARTSPPVRAGRLVRARPAEVRQLEPVRRTAR